MKTSVYISSSSIKAVVGDVTRDGIDVKAAATIPLSPEAVINGVVLDDAAVRKGLEKLKTKLGGRLNGCRLILDNSQIMTKRLNVPLLGEQQMYGLVEGEFSSNESRESFVYDYMVLKGGSKENGAEILAGAVEKSLIKSYVDLFAGVGIKVGTIDLAIASVINITGSIAGFKHSNCIIAVLDGNSMNSFLVLKGVYKMFNRARLFEERGTSASAAELTKILSSIIQFNSTDRTSEAVSEIFFCNIAKSELILSESSRNDGAIEFGAVGDKAKPQKTAGGSLFGVISSNLNVKVGLLPDFVKLPSADRVSSTTADYIYNIGSLFGR